MGQCSGKEQPNEEDAYIARSAQPEDNASFQKNGSGMCLLFNLLLVINLIVICTGPPEQVTLAQGVTVAAGKFIHRNDCQLVSTGYCFCPPPPLAPSSTTKPVSSGDQLQSVPSVTDKIVKEVLKRLEQQKSNANNRSTNESQQQPSQTSSTAETSPTIAPLKPALTGREAKSLVFPNSPACPNYQSNCQSASN